MTEPAGTAKWSDVVLVTVRFGSLSMLPIAGLSIFHGLLPYWGAVRTSRSASPQACCACPGA